MAAVCASSSAVIRQACPALRHLRAAFAPAAGSWRAAVAAVGRCPARRSFSQQVVRATAEVEAAAPAAAAAAEAPDVSKMDIRVGKILSCEQHPDADSLYVETIDLGEAEGPRTIVSGLVKYVPLEAMQDRAVIVLANLKPRNMRGIKSNGMVLCASNADHTAVEPLAPPTGAAVGERVFFGESAEQGEAANPNQVQKKKLWEAVQPLLKTDGACVAGFDGQTMMTSAGPVTAASLAGANIS